MSQPSRTAMLLFLATVAGCIDELPPPPVLEVTSPARGPSQGDPGHITVRGTARPGLSGAPVIQVRVNDQIANLAADGSFTADLTIPPGAMLLTTIAYSAEGAKATDARAVQVGERRTLGSKIDRAVTATLSTQAFARLSAAAGPIVRTTNFTTLLAPRNPMANVGSGSANAKISVNKLTLGDVKVTLTPVDGGLQFSAELTALDASTKVAYGGTFVPDGSTMATITADKVIISGTLAVTPTGTNGFTTKVEAPTVQTTNLKLKATGTVGTILNLLNSTLGDTIKNVVTGSLEGALEPVINSALGALAGPQQFDVMGKSLAIQAAPSRVEFTADGALVTLDLAANIGGNRAEASYIFTPNGEPTLDVGNGLQLAIADDLVNQLLSSVHASGQLDIDVPYDLDGIADGVKLSLDMPPMISASNEDGTLRLVIGDMNATVMNEGRELITAKVNASVDLEVVRGDEPNEIALGFKDIQAFVNLVGAEDDPSLDILGAAKKGIGIQIKDLEKFMIKVPVPTIAGVQLDSLALRADSGYLIASGQIH